MLHRRGPARPRAASPSAARPRAADPARPRAGRRSGLYSPGRRGRPGRRARPDRRVRPSARETRRARAKAPPRRARTRTGSRSRAGSPPRRRARSPPPSPRGPDTAAAGVRGEGTRHRVTHSGEGRCRSARYGRASWEKRRDRAPERRTGRKKISPKDGLQYRLKRHVWGNSQRPKNTGRIFNHLWLRRERNHPPPTARGHSSRRRAASRTPARSSR